MAALSSDRRAGSFDIAQPGDLTDSGKNPNPSPDPPLVEETDVLPGPPPAPQEGAPTKPLEGDTDGDGKLSNREKKNLKKE